MLRVASCFCEFVGLRFGRFGVLRLSGVAVVSGLRYWFVKLLRVCLLILLLIQSFPSSAGDFCGLLFSCLAY